MRNVPSKNATPAYKF